MVWARGNVDVVSMNVQYYTTHFIRSVAVVSHLIIGIYNEIQEREKR